MPTVEAPTKPRTRATARTNEPRSSGKRKKALGNPLYAELVRRVLPLPAHGLTEQQQAVVAYIASQENIGIRTIAELYFTDDTKKLTSTALVNRLYACGYRGGQNNEYTLVPLAIQEEPDPVVFREYQRKWAEQAKRLLEPVFAELEKPEEPSEDSD